MQFCLHERAEQREGGGGADAVGRDVVLGPGGVAVNAAKAWARVEPNGNAPASYNIASVVHNGAPGSGDYTITFATPFASADYVVMVTIIGGAGFAFAQNPTTTTIDVGTRDTVGGPTDSNFALVVYAP